MVRSQTAAVMPRGGSSALPQYLGNGVASLFQDEQVLSGDGRLEAGRYEFGFDLLFPEKVLPSSIEVCRVALPVGGPHMVCSFFFVCHLANEPIAQFERGTISYMITATLTRPTAIAPTISCDRRVILAQQIDVGDVSPPRPRTIFLEPISKRSRKKRTATSERSKLASQQESPSTEVGSEVGTDPSIAGDVGRDSATEHRSGTDGRSEFSGESNRSVSTGMSRSELSTLSNVTSTKQQVVDDKTITATIELLKGGYMPGDAVTVRVTVQHIKHIKSMNGVIVTLYRQGKIDSAPSATLFIGNGDKALDEAYPRSRTGLAGLSISSTSSRSMFRKDLDQNVVPLIIDPITLHATVTVTLKLPDNSFPSIKGVPGGMIGFKYQAEVIVDLGGRLSSQITQGGTSTRYGSFAVNGTEQASVGFGPRTATSIMDTTPLRRQKGVISVSMEFIVGTQDSSRTRKQAALRKRVIRIADGDEQQHLDEPPTPAEHAPPSNNGFANPSPLPTPNSRPPYSPPANNMLPPQAGPSSAPSYPQQQQNGYFNDTVPAYIPRPQLPTENNISEKDRIRQAETRLLPSQPSAPAEASSSSAPPDEDLYSNQDAPHAPPADLLLPSAPLASTEAGPSAPTLDEVVSPTHPTEDKQELERRRLIDEASAPPEVPDDFDEQQHRPDAPSAPDLDNAEPSAPVLNEDDDFEGFGMQAGPSTAGPSTNGEQLPAYQR